MGRGAGAVWPLLLIAFGGGNEAEGGANFLQGALVAVAFPLTLVLLWREHAHLPHDPRARQALTVGLLLSLVALVDGVAAHSTVRHLAPVAHLGFAFAGAALVLLARRLLTPSAFPPLPGSLSRLYPARSRSLFSTPSPGRPLRGLDSGGPRARSTPAGAPKLARPGRGPQGAPRPSPRRWR